MKFQYPKVSNCDSPKLHTIYCIIYLYISENSKPIRNTSNEKLSDNQSKSYPEYYDHSKRLAAAIL